MTKANQTNEPLTEEQQQLVRENLGLVAVHLRRHVRNLSEPRRDREWDDLFQEGCLGLVRAAIKYRAERGIPFAAFALPRIHNAVSKALRSKFSTVRIPPGRSTTPQEPPTNPIQGEAATGPKVYALTDELMLRLPDRRHHDPPDPSRETIRQRLRDKYERAVRVAGEEIAGKTSTRGDRGQLAHLLIEERFFVPHEEAKRALRQIARDTRSSYARVAQCEKQLSELVRRTLEADPEFRELRRCARAQPLGSEIPIDDEIERDLLLAGSEEFVRRYRHADPTDRARILHTVLRLSQTNVEDIIRTRFSRLTNRVRRGLLEDTVDLCRPMPRADRKNRRFPTGSTNSTDWKVGPTPRVGPACKSDPTCKSGSTYKSGSTCKRDPNVPAKSNRSEVVKA